MNADELLRFMAEPDVADYLERMTATAPPFSERQRVVLAELLRPVRRAIT